MWVMYKSCKNGLDISSKTDFAKHVIDFDLRNVFADSKLIYRNATWNNILSKYVRFEICVIIMLTL